MSSAAFVTEDGAADTLRAALTVHTVSSSSAIRTALRAVLLWLPDVTKPLPPGLMNPGTYATSRKRGVFRGAAAR